MPAFLDRAKAHLESGLYFDPPSDRAFRLDQSPHAARLFKGLGIQEMDFGWWDAGGQTMHLLEVKDYSLPGVRFDHQHFLNECLGKATDCLLFLGSIWHGLPLATEARDSVPDEWHALPEPPSRLNLHFVVKVPEPAQDPLGLDRLQSTAQNRIRGRLALLGVGTATQLFVMDHRTAGSRLPLRTDEDLAGPPRRGRRR